LLRFLRLLGLLAPVAVLLRLGVFPELERALRTQLVEEISFWNAALSALAGAGLACLLASLWIGFRLGSLGRAADLIAEGDYSIRLQVPRGGVERQLTAAINTLAKELSEKHSAATVDKLTQIPNRSAILPALFNEVERVNRYNRPLSVAFADIDHFKQVNDVYGHDAGDLVLRRVAGVLKDNVRATDLVARYGGEEFMLLLTETDIEEAARLSEKLRLLVAGEQIHVDSLHSVSVTISIGVAGGVGSQVRFDTIVRDADAAMYSAKNLGRNQVYVFAEPDDEERVTRAPISPEGRASAAELGRAARAAAEEKLRSLLAESETDESRTEHITRVAVEMARHLGAPDAEVERIRIASLLHDVGAVAVPQEILSKAEPLTSAEWQRVIQHPRIGQLILEQASSLRDAIPIVLHHHERFAGHGYPHGLKGLEIPLGARILAVADAYDAMTSDRPYRPRVDHARAIGELQRNAGSQFDPDVVAAFRALYEHEAPGPDEPPTLVPLPGGQPAHPEPNTAAG
jgi:diguanylate cyclase (GGDEF)-like protein